MPGDIVNLNDPPLHVFPADMFLLSGDAIVNESMLTGESVPVSKVSIKDEDLARWKDSKEPTGDTIKSFLYAGTRVIRIRGVLATDGGMGQPAVGIVVRTGTYGFCSYSRHAMLIIVTRFQHDKGRPRPVDVVPQAHRVQILSRLDSLHFGACGTRWSWLLR